MKCTNIIVIVTIIFFGVHSTSVDLSSKCSIDSGCPRSSMVWASGTFTEKDVLTPSAFLAPLASSVGESLTLQLSLCCGYLFHGKMLRDAAMYNGFLDTLLHATPFRVLSMDEKNLLFPREMAEIRSQQTKKVFKFDSILTDDELLFDNDGDGDVLVLRSGTVGAGILAIPLVKHTTTGAAPKHDVQLMLSNSVLKCKCPHTLTVMPLLYYNADTVPQVAIVGVGSACATTRELLLPTASAARDGSETLVFRRRFQSSAEIPPLTTVEWRVSVQQRHQQDEQEELVVDHSPVDPMLLFLPPSAHSNRRSVHSFRTITTFRHSSGCEEPQKPDDAASSCFAQLVIEAHPNVHYNVELRLAKGDASYRVDGSFVVRLQFADWTSTYYSPTPLFGMRQKLRFHSTITSSLRAALESSYYKGYWIHSMPQRQRARHDVNILLNVSTLDDHLLVAGENKFEYFIADREESCPPTLLETRRVWSLFPSIVQPTGTPVVPCQSNSEIEARSLPVALQDDSLRTLWTENGVAPVETGSHWVCDLTVETDGAPQCNIVDTYSRRTQLIMDQRSIATIAWKVGVSLSLPMSLVAVVQKEWVSASEATVRVMPMDDGAVAKVVITMASAPVVLYRKTQLYPPSLTIDINTADESFVAAAPEGAVGSWRTAAPLALATIAKSATTVSIDSSRVPNVIRVLPVGSLQFVVEDKGDDYAAISARFPSKVPHTLIPPSFVAKCPPFAIEYAVNVTAVPPREVEPSIEYVFLENSVVTLRAPRNPAKDEAISWVRSCDRSSENMPVVSRMTASYAEVIDVNPHTQCNVTWSATNLVGSAGKVFVIRRCEAPPLLKFLKPTDQPWHLREGPYEPIAPVIVTEPIVYHSALLSPVGSVDVPFRCPLLAVAGGAAEQSGKLVFQHLAVRNQFSSEFWRMSTIAVRSATLVPSQHEIGFDRFERDNALMGDEVRVAPVVTQSGRQKHSMLNFLETAPKGVSASLSLLQYRTSVNASLVDDKTEWAEFEQRDLCKPREASVCLLHLEPLGVISPHGFDNDTGLPLLEFCHDDFHIESHKDLYEKYFYSLAWKCYDENPRTFSSDSSGHAEQQPQSQRVRVEVVTPVHTIIRSLSSTTGVNVFCTLTLSNPQTRTSSAPQLYLVRRVFASMFNVTLTIVSANSVNTTSSSSSATPTAPQQSSQRGGSRYSRQRVVPPPTSLHSQQVPSRIKKFFGRTVDLLVPRPATLELTLGSESWKAVSVTPAFQLNEYIGTSVLLGRLTFQILPQEDDEGVITRIDGFDAPGVYTLAYSQRDPGHPVACPTVRMQQSIQVFRAQVQQDEITLCDSVATVQALPLPSELGDGFYGQWEVVSRQVAENVTLSSGADFHGIRFDYAMRPRTIVRGLPFGIVTLRWAVYKNIVAQDGSRVVSRLLVDEAHVTVYVLTENLATERVVTLADFVDVAVTSSTHSWRFDVPQTTILSRVSQISMSAVDNSTLGAVMHVDRLRLGVTRLRYELRPSQRMFQLERMANRSCPVAPPSRLFEVERVSAYLSLRAIEGVEECDAYHGNVTVTLCLEAGDATSAKFFNERVSLIDGGLIEATIKGEAAALVKDSMCSVPWWVTDAARWTSVYCLEDNRCVRIQIKAARHLSSWELAHPMFEALQTSNVAGLSGPLHQRSTAQTHQRCAAGADIISSKIVEGVSSHQSGGMKPYLPVLDRSTLRVILPATLKPLVGLAGAADFSTTEGYITGATPLSAGHNQSSSAQDEFVIAQGPSLVLRLDNAHPNWTSAFPTLARNASSLDTAGEPSHDSKDQPQTLLDKCLTHSLLGADVLPTWSEANRARRSGERSESNQRLLVSIENSKEWDRYVNRVASSRVLCEVLFPSIERYLPRPHDTADSLRERQQSRTSPLQQRLVSLFEIEAQLDALNRSHHWTRDGIEITGLRDETQAALNRKRITKRQLEEIQAHRAAAQGSNGGFFSSLFGGSVAAQRLGVLTEHDVVQQQASKEADPTTQSVAINHEQDSLVPRGVVPLRGYRSRVLNALKRYRDATRGEGLTAIRLTLPSDAHFAAPHDLHLRTSIHKDIICGSNVNKSERHANSLVNFARLTIEDQAPEIAVSPASIRQCDVEASIPPIVISLNHSNFKEAIFSNSAGAASSAAELIKHLRDRVTLEEVHNANISQLLAREAQMINRRHPTGRSPPTRWSYNSDNVGLKPCIAFMMRGLKLTLDEDTGKQLTLVFSPCPAFQMISRDEYNERQESDALLERLQYPRLLRVRVRDVIQPDSFGRSSNAEFILEVKPTIVKLNVRELPDVGRDYRTAHLPARAVTNLLTSQVISGDKGVNRRTHSLVVCESVLKRQGFEIDLELFGDQWDSGVGRNTNGGRRTETTESRDVSIGDATKAPDSSYSWRSPHDTALLNSFSHVEHHRMDAASYSFMAVGLYRSHFVNYLFSSVLSDHLLLARYPFVWRHNDTFVSVRVPPAPSQSEEVSDGDGLPLAVPFPTIEEILFAIPGIATQCQGCLLADRTFFVGGDWSGVWSSPTARPAAAATADRILSSPFVIPLADDKELPTLWEYHWLCAATSHAALSSFTRRFARGGNSKNVHVSLVAEVHVLQARDLRGNALPAQQRPVLLMTTDHADLRKQTTAQAVLKFTETEAKHAYSTLHDDLKQRYGRNHLLPLFDIVRDPQSGQLTVNATILLKACLTERGAATAAEVQCTVLNYHPAVVVIENGARAFAEGFAALWDPLVVLHQLGSAVVYFHLDAKLFGDAEPRLSVLRTCGVFVLMCCCYATIEVAWMLLWLGLWTATLRAADGLGGVVCFGLHGLLWLFTSRQ